MKNRARRIIAIFLSVTFISIFLCSCSGNVAIDTKTEETVSIPSSVNSAVSSETTSSEITSSKDTSTQTTSSEVTSSKDTSTQTTSSEVTSSKDTSTQTTSSEVTSSKDTSTQTTSSEVTSSKDTSTQTTSSEVSTPNQDTSSSTNEVDSNYPYYGGAISCPVGSELDILAYNDAGWKLVKIDISDSGTNATIVKGTNIVRINPSIVYEYTLTATFKSTKTEAIEKPTLVITVTDSFNLGNIFSDEPGFDTGF